MQTAVVPSSRSGKLSFLQILQRQGPLLTVAWLFVILVVIDRWLPQLRMAVIQMYVAEPLMWLSLAGLVWWLRRLSGEAVPFQGMVLLVGFTLGVFHVVILFLSGFIWGFGRSPYSHRWYWLLLNWWYVGTRLLALELTRWYLIRMWKSRRPLLGFLGAWLLLVFVTLPLGTLELHLTSARKAVQYTGKFVLPYAAEGLLANFLAISGGPWMSLAYRGTLELFEWTSPILPNLEWIIMAFVGTLTPLLGISLLSFLQSDPEARKTEEASASSSSFTGWIGLAVLAVVLFFFNAGVFGVQPTLVSGYSMKPTFVAGDVVITRRIKPEEVQVGDVIRFEQDGVHVLHRVIEIQKTENGGLVFITLGDNNQSPDPPVTPDRLRGEVILVIPKLGWIAIAVRWGLKWVAGLLG